MKQCLEEFEEGEDYGETESRNLVPREVATWSRRGRRRSSRRAQAVVGGEGTAFGQWRRRRRCGGEERRLRLLLPGSAIMMNLSSGGEDFDDAALDAHLATCAAARAERWAAY